MSDYQLGQPVRFKHYLKRRSPFWEKPDQPFNKFWTTELYPGKHTEGGLGIIIGKRTLANGNNTYHGYDEPIVFVPKERFTAYLVAFDLRRKPVFVLPEHLEESS